MVHFPALASLLVLLQSLRGSAEKVCQFMSEAGSSLQDVVGAQCNVTKDDFGIKMCHCSSSLMEGPTWLFLSHNMTQTLANHPAPPGEWYIMDESRRCVVSLDGSVDQPLPQPCPPGFFCEGGSHPARSCWNGDHCPGRTPKKGRRCKLGNFCPLPAGPMLPCPDGAECPTGAVSPNACKEGYFCKAGISAECPSGFYCPFGSVEPRKCHVYASCPPGSWTENTTVAAVMCVFMSAGVAVMGARLYGFLVKRGLLTCIVCFALVCVMWAVNGIIGGFLALIYVSVTVNWALLQLGSAPPCTSPVLMCITLALAVYSIWKINPPWALFAGGLLACSLIGWLMSRQSFAVVVLGRVLMFLAFCCLIFLYAEVDLVFALVVCGLLVLTIVFLLSSWILKRQHPHRLPFFSRWGPEYSARFVGSANDMHVNLSSFEFVTTPFRFAFSPRSSLSAPGQRRLQQSFGGAGVVHTRDASRSSTGILDTDTALVSDKLGVGFHLDKVSFDIPDGKQILKDITLDIAPKRRVAVMGASGSGKTTLLAVLSGRASYGHIGGSVLVGGEPADDLRFLRHVTGFVPQDDVLHGDLTVEENIRFQAQLRLPSHMTASQIDQNVERVVKDLNLSKIVEERVGTTEHRGISGGQRKRVSIAMELVMKPLLLFADEPTSGLDSTTSHEVVKQLNSGAARLGTTVIAVIHQPRYETLCEFDDLVLLALGGLLVYAGPVTEVKDHFRDNLQVAFPQHTNPADVFLDAIQPSASLSPEDCAQAWRQCAPAKVLRKEGSVPKEYFYRSRPPFFRAVLIYMDRSVLQVVCAWRSIALNQALCTGTTCLLCTILTFRTFDQFILQSALAALFFMLLESAAAQQTFGADKLVMFREARVGMPMVAFFFSKDLAALFEVTLSAFVFAAVYGSQSGGQIPLREMFAGSWAYTYAVVGLSYIFSILLPSGAAQMTAVVLTFVCFCVSGVYQPQLPEIAAMLNGRAWMIPALSPVRWFWGFLLTQEVSFLTDITRHGAQGTLRWKGYDLDFLGECDSTTSGIDSKVQTLPQAWEKNRAWVCSVSEMILLGVVFRFLACVCLILCVNAQTSGWARFFGQSKHGLWKLAGHLFMLLLGSFMALFLFAEIYAFGIVKL